MTTPIQTFAAYVASLGRLTLHVDPTLETPETEQIRAAAEGLADLAEISRQSPAAWALARPTDAPVLAQDLSLMTAARTRFTGRNGRTAPCDLAVLSGAHVVIAVAARGLDSTGSKLTDAVCEVEEMADVRLPTQFIMVVIDGIGSFGRPQERLIR